MYRMPEAMLSDLIIGCLFSCPTIANFQLGTILLAFRAYVALLIRHIFLFLLVFLVTTWIWVGAAATCRAGRGQEQSKSRYHITRVLDKFRIC